MDIQKQLVEAYNIFKDVFKVHNTGNPIRSKINLLILEIELFYGVKKEEIEQLLFDYYIYNEMYIKYDPDKSDIKTFVFQFVLSKLTDIKRNRSSYRYNKEQNKMVKKNYRKGDYMDIANRDYDIEIDDLSDNDPICNIEIKDIYKLAEKKITDPIDRKVILGELTIKEGADNQNRNYKTYYSSINKLKNEFKKVLLDEGYELHKLRFLD